MRRTNLPGHALRSEGKPYLACRSGWDRVTDSWTGRALCECGWTSAVLSSNGQRKRAHADHKAGVRAALSSKEN
jgi:hypothetical protein